jgi:hypothetical protein
MNWFEVIGAGVCAGVVVFAGWVFLVLLFSL